MELVTHKKFKNGRLMPWGKGTVVSGAKGTVYLCGNTATSADYDPAAKKGGGFAGDAAAQWREVLGNIKSDLEELGSGLDHLIRLTFFVKGPFPDGGVRQLVSSDTKPAGSGIKAAALSHGFSRPARGARRDRWLRGDRPPVCRSGCRDAFRMS
ncbi:endoribonuclease L-PSP [Mesorhizobium sp. LSHC422A00]|uniref:endoribonuclease L-PSP n=1 Tax=Mesorhizobium sp. LSHC422A00 TaxID=1287294 RepID=UPI0003CEB329|nr:endoribonuclease L-PSP [Mesorhizobium sp. LSHC422A00]ESX61542.1 endoribonuclease L-PSP [Mesorhizobium sp. LSHC422A00]